jgi:hypothetical protein
MGTNYYMVKGQHIPETDYDHPLNGLLRDGTGVCAKIHIGKSSGGWCFSLHVMPEHGIHNLQDWKALVERLLADGWRIEDEYREIITQDVLWDVVERAGERWVRRDGRPLMRHLVDESHCIGNGEGLYDYVLGHFS